MGIDTTILLNLVMATVKQIPDKFWDPSDLVSEVKANAPSTDPVSSAEVKGALWRLAGDHQINMTPDYQITAASSESEVKK